MTAVADRWAGAGVAPGTALAAAWQPDRSLPPAPGEGVDETRVRAAFEAVAADLDRAAGEARAQGRHAAADIVATGALIAADPGLVGAAVRATTPAGISGAVEEYARLLDALPDPTLRERAADVRQVGRRVLARLAGGGAPPPAHRFVLVATELGPADVLDYLGHGLAAAVAVRGGANSHAAIVARSVGLPVVAGVDPSVLDLPDGTPLLVDADGGVVLADPPSAELARADATAESDRRRRALLAAERGAPHATRDGQPFGLLCNVASDVEARAGRDSGADGIGLLRTELPFVHATAWPTETEHRRALRPVLAEAVGWPVTVRLLDFANDKVPPFLDPDAAGLAALLAHPEALRAQLRAIAAVGGDADLRVLVPMVSGAGDLHAVRAAMAELGLTGVPVGAMVETAGAVAAIGEVCAAADFLSLGTNDLTAEILRLGRTDPRARPELTADPSVLAAVGTVVAAARVADRPVSVCGDAGAHPVTLPLLLGAGVRAFSVACARVDETRYRLRRLDTAGCAELFAEACALPDATAVAALVRQSVGTVVP